MGYKKYGSARIKPEGTWVQTTHLLNVAGLHARKPAVRTFAGAVRRAEQSGKPYGLMLERQPNNKHDPNAIAVFGIAEVRRWFRWRTESWHIGFVPADEAESVSRDLIDMGVPVGVELYQIVEGVGHYFEVKFFVLAPPGNGVAKRLKSRAG